MNAEGYVLAEVIPVLKAEPWIVPAAALLMLLEASAAVYFAGIAEKPTDGDIE